jgi:hypothetical protein
VISQYIVPVGVGSEGNAVVDEDAGLGQAVVVFRSAPGDVIEVLGVLDIHCGDRLVQRW